MTPQPRKGFQNLGFGGVLSSLSFAAERKGAVGDIKTAAPGKRIATAAERSRNDTPKIYPVIPNQCAHWCGNPFPLQERTPLSTRLRQCSTM